MDVVKEAMQMAVVLEEDARNRMSVPPRNQTRGSF